MTGDKRADIMAITGANFRNLPPAEARPYAIAPAGFRLPDEIHLGVVRLQIADLSRSLDYYQRVLGLRAVNRTEAIATLAAPSDDTPLIELHQRRDAAPVPRRGRLGLYHYALLLPDRPSLGRFVAHLATLGEYAGMADHLVSEAVYLTDPDGLGIEVYTDRPRSSWLMQGPALAMATDPLDLDALARAAGGQPWSGTPAGTRLGHVHLHVGDLDRSAEFYHAGLGFDRIVLNLPGALFMSAGGYHHHLGTNTWAQGAAPAAEGDARLLEWTIQVPQQPDVDAAAGSLAAAGYDVVRDSADAVSADPWGTSVRVSAA
jgi:catechol 2,3-dioxygenase